MVVEEEDISTSKKDREGVLKEGNPNYEAIK